MTEEEWEEGWARAIAMRLGGKALEEVDSEGNRVVDDDLFLLLNGHYEPVTFCLPADPVANAWVVVVDTATGEVNGEKCVIAAGEEFDLPARSLLLLKNGPDS
jgi:glycogen operon protein